MKIMVIGARGYVGSLLCLKLSTHHEVIEVDRKTGGERMNTSVPDDTDVVVDLAATAHGPTPDLHDVFVNNAIEPRLLLSRLPPGCHYIIPSSLSVFAGDGAGPYPASKRSLERLMLSKKDYPHTVSIVRFGTLFGATEPACMRWHLLLNSMVRSAVREGVVVVNGVGVRRPVLSLDAAVQALIELVEDKTGCHGEIRNLYHTSGTLQEFGEFVADLTGTRVVTRWQDSDRRDYGFGPCNPARIEGALRRLIDWTKKHEAI